VTLTTGVPNPNTTTGAVSYSVSTGTVSVGGAGLAGVNGQTLGAQPLGAIDLIGRQLSIEAPIVASGKVRLRAGAMGYDQDADLESALASDVVVPAISGAAITSSAAGTIKAGAISVLSKDVSLGVALTVR
jgi:hypothetical protein